MSTEQQQQETISQNLDQEYAENYNNNNNNGNDDNDNDGEIKQLDITTKSNYIPRSSKTPEEIEEQKEIDSRSVYVGNVDYKTTPEELDEFFKNIGSINRVTILYDRFTGYPKGYAYIEFESKNSVNSAIELNGVDFKNRKISIVAKRTNLPGFKKNGGRGGFRGRGGRGNGRGGSFRGRGRGRGGRGRGNGRGGSSFRGGYKGDFNGVDTVVQDIDPTTTAHPVDAE